MKEKNVYMRDILPIENPRFHNGEDLSDLRDIFQHKRQLLLPLGIAYGQKIILCDGHKRTIKAIIKGDTIPTIRILETDLDIETYGTGAVLSQYRSIEDFKKWYTEIVEPEMKENGIGCILDYPLFKNINKTITKLR